MAVRNPTKQALDRIGEEVEELQIFEEGQCVSPKECGVRPVILVVARIGTSVAVGLYCLNHRGLLDMVTQAAKEV